MPEHDALCEQIADLLATDPSLGNREIGRRLGVSKDAVRRRRDRVRQLAHPARATEPPTAPTTPPGAPNAPPDAPVARATHAEPAPPGAHRLVLDVHGDLREDLAVLAEAGHDPHSAVTLAVQLLADAYRTAWDYGQYDRGTQPPVRVRTTGGRPFLPPPAHLGTLSLAGPTAPTSTTAHR